MKRTLKRLSRALSLALSFALAHVCYLLELDDDFRP